MPQIPQTNRPLVLASVIAAMFMVAIEATIVATVMPQIAGQLGGLNLYSWVFSSFLLTQTATTVVFGKLSDLYGRKPVLLFGIAVFLVGSVLAGFAWSMPSMIVFRLIQGIGAGSIQPVGMTVVGDLYSARERGKIQGFLASVWGISAVLGPLAGALIIQKLSWAWIFWINVPIGIVAAAGFMLFLHEGVAHRRRSIDVAGATLFTISVASLMVALTEFGTSDTAGAVVASALFLVSGGLFLWQEGRTADPMVALDLWGRRPIAAANGASLLAGMAVIGLTTFLPMYVQGVMQQSALVAGFALTMLVLGWPIGATLAARALVRFGLRSILLLGSILLPLGALAFLFLESDSSPLVAGAGSLVMGFGMGLLSTASLVLIQEIVDWAQRGSATASNLFSRNLGSTLGATLFGAVLNYGLLHSQGGSVSSDQLRRLLDAVPGSGAVSTSLPAGADGIRTVLQHSLHLTFWAVFVVAALTVLLAAFVPSVALRHVEEAPAE